MNMMICLLIAYAFVSISTELVYIQNTDNSIQFNKILVNIESTLFALEPKTFCTYYLCFSKQKNQK